MPTVKFVNDGRTFEILKGTSVLETAMEHGVNIYHTCGGNASCSTCRVKVLSGAGDLSAIGPAEAQILDAFDLKPPYRLACQSLVLRGSVAVEIPGRDREPRPNKTPVIPDERS